MDFNEKLKKLLKKLSNKFAKIQSITASFQDEEGDNVWATLTIKYFEEKKLHINNTIIKDSASDTKKLKDIEELFRIMMKEK